MQLDAGYRIADQYEVLGPIGRGGFGMVFRARDLKLGREVAIKILNENTGGFGDTFAQRFQREIKLVRQLEHPNIVRLYDYGDADGAPFMVMEFVRGIEVADFLQRHGPLTHPMARSIMLQLLDGLVAAHELAIVHRDLKPNNLMLTEVGMRTDFLKILDFGIAKAIHGAERDTKVTFQTQNQLVGTPSYMSPEQLRQEPVGPQVDIYAAGLIFIELLTGRALLEGTMLEVVAAHIDKQPHRIPEEVSHSPFLQIITTAIEKDATLRFADARQMYKAIEAVQLAPDDAAPLSLSLLSPITGKQNSVQPKAHTPHDLPLRASIDTGRVASMAATPSPVPAKGQAPSPPTTERSSLPLILAILLVAVLTGAALLLVLILDRADPPPQQVALQQDLAPTNLEPDPPTTSPVAPVEAPTNDPPPAAEPPPPTPAPTPAQLSLCTVACTQATAAGSARALPAPKPTPIKPSSPRTEAKNDRVQVAFSTTPAGATIQAAGLKCTSPCSLQLPRTKATKVTVTLARHKTYTTTLRPRADERLNLTLEREYKGI